MNAWHHLACTWAGWTNCSALAQPQFHFVSSTFGRQQAMNTTAWLDTCCGQTLAIWGPFNCEGALAAACCSPWSGQYQDMPMCS